MKKMTFFLLLAFTFIQNSNAQILKDYRRLSGENIRLAAIVPVSEDASSNLFFSGNYNDMLVVGESDQAGVIIWSKKIAVADTSYAINQMIKDSEGNLVIVGAGINGEVGHAFAMKFNTTTFHLSWYITTEANTYFWDIAEIGPGGDYIIGGQEIDNGGGNGSDDITYFANRTTGELTLLGNYDKHLNETVESLVYDEISEKIYTTGRYELQIGSSKYRICLNEMNLDGSLAWTKYYVNDLVTPGRFYSEDMIIDGDKIIMVGAGDNAGTSSNRYLWLIRTEMDGSNACIVKYDISTLANDGVISAIKKVPGGYVIYGNLYSPSGYTDVFLMRVLTDGTIVWAKSYPFSTHLPTTGLFNSGALCVIGNKAFLVGENMQMDGSRHGNLLRVNLTNGELGSCDMDLSVIVNITSPGFVGVDSLDSVSCSVDFIYSTPSVTNMKYKSSMSCSNNGTRENSLVGDELIESFNMYPNPASTALFIQMSDDNSGDVELFLYDISGVLIKHQSSNSGIFNINLNGFSKGMYIVKMCDVDGGIIGTKSLVIQ